MVTKLSCFNVSFCAKDMLLKTSEIMLEAEADMVVRDVVNRIAWSRTSPRYVCVRREIAILSEWGDGFLSGATEDRMTLGSTGDSSMPSSLPTSGSKLLP